MQTRQTKSHNPNTAPTKAAETTQRAAMSAASATRIPVWANGMGDQLPAGLVLPDTGIIPGIQTKLAISQPNDPYEQEADQVAEKVMRMPASPAVVQRKCACGGIAGPTGECEACAAKRQALQRRATEQTSESSAPPIVNQVLSSGNGHPLDAATRAFMEPRFGTDFSQVRVHAGIQAAESAQSVNALAYTVGSDVVFGSGQYRPETSGGQTLLAHELTHVVQQSVNPALLQRIQRKPEDYQHPEDGAAVKQRMQQEINQALGRPEEEQSPQLEGTKANTEENSGDKAAAGSEAQKAAHTIDRTELEEKKRELLPEAAPDVDRVAEQQPLVEQSSDKVKEEAEQPTEPIVKSEKQAAPKEEEVEPGAEAMGQAEEAATIAQQAFDAVNTEVPPEPQVAVVPPKPVIPVDRKGEPLPTDPGADAEVTDLANQAQNLREQGQRLRERATEERGNVKILRGNIGLVQQGIGQAEAGTQTSLAHLAFRQDLVGQAQQALTVSEQKATMVAEQAPGYSSKADQGKEDSGPMAREAGEMAAKNKANTPDDPEAGAKAREQGDKIDKVGSDAVTVDDAITQTKGKAETLAQDAAQATKMNTATREKIGEMEGTLKQTNQHLTQMTEQTAQARAQVEDLTNQPDDMAKQADALDERGQELIQASFDIERRLQEVQQNYQTGMQGVPGVETEEEGETGVQSAPSSTMGQEGEIAAQGPSSPIGGEEEVGAQGVPGIEIGEAQGEILQGEVIGQQPPLEGRYEQREHVELVAKLPSWLTGEKRVSEKEREEARLKEEERRRNEIDEINKMAGNRFEDLSAADKLGIALRLTGRNLFGSISGIRWPGWGNLAKGLIDPRGPLTGVVSGLSMMLSGAANLFSAEQWSRDPLGNLLKSAADIATGLTIILGSITALAGVIIVLMTAISILSLGAAALITGPVIAFCATVLTTVGGWTIAVGKVALILQALVLIKNLIDAATAQTAEDLQNQSDQIREDIANAGNVVMQIGMAKLSQIGGRALSSEIEATKGGAVQYARGLPGKFAQGVRTMPSRVVRGVKALPGRVVSGARAVGRGVKAVSTGGARLVRGAAGRVKSALRALGREGQAEAGALTAGEAARLGTEAEEIARLGKMTPETQAMLEQKPALREALVENPRAADALKLCKSYCFPENATPAQIRRLEKLLSDMEEAGGDIRRARLDLKEYLHNNRANLDSAIDRLEEAFQGSSVEVQGVEAVDKSVQVAEDIKSVQQLGTPETEVLEHEHISVGEPTETPSGELAPPGRGERLSAGNEFNRIGAKKYPYNEVQIRTRSGRLVRVDSYNPTTGEIVSRKFTQLAELDHFDALDYLQELRVKYPPDALIADVPKMRELGLANQRLQGSLILEVPVQKNPIPQELLDYARSRGITIRDIAGHEYH